MNKRDVFKGVALALLVGLITACAPTRYVRPLDKGEVAIGGSFGGPLIEFAGLVTPIPFTSVQAGYGIDSTLTAFGGVGITSAMYGVLQTDLGVTKSVLQPDGARPGISITPVANFNVDFNGEANFTFYPQLDINAWWEYREKRPDFAYVGISNWFELQGKRAHDEPQPTRWVPAFQVGHCWSLEHVDWRVQSNFIAPFNNNQNLVASYATPTKKGAFGLYVTYTRRLGK